MSITVEQALKLGGLSQGRLLAGARGLRNIVENVNIIEALSDSDWETGWQVKNHLLLTTFNAAKDNVEQQVRILEVFAGGGCAALVFQQGIIDQLSPRVVQRAEELGLPLVEVPETATYPMIITPLVGAILREKTFLLQRAQEIHGRLTDLILRGGGPEAIVSAVAGLINRPVAIADPYGNLLASANLDADEVAACIPTLLSRASGVRPTDPFWDDAQRLWITPLRAGHRQALDGFIVVSSPTGPLDRFDRTAVEQAATIASLDLLKQKAVLEAERRLKRDFIEDMLAGSYHSVEAMSARARSLGWELLHKRVVVVVDLNSFERYYLTHLERGEQYFQQIKEQFLHTVAHVVLERRPQSIVVDRSDSILLMPHFEQELPPSLARQDVQALAEAICYEAQSQLDELSISIAIGGFYDSVEGLRHSYSEAQAALNAANRIARQQPIIWYDDVALYVLLDRLALQPEAGRWFGHTLGSLVEYDERHGTDLVKTLETYFDANQVVQQAAHQLCIHPKTLKYRLQRVKEILGTDPFCGDRQLTFYLATKLSRLL